MRAWLLAETLALLLLAKAIAWFAVGMASPLATPRARE